ncbi:MAG: dynamin family protein [Acidimicrobiales bacterium]
MPAGELLERVAQLIRDAAAAVDDDTRSQLEQFAARLREPPRVAVVGRVKAGKSTLVNAILGQRVAPTNVSECTKLVTWFRYGHPERLVVHLKNGTSHESQLDPSGMLPEELDTPIAEVASLEAFLANDALRWMTLIDTPGIGSVNRDRSAATEELLASAKTTSWASRAADAIVFVLNHSLLEDEKSAIEVFASGEGEQSASAANALGVLSRADQLGDGSVDPWGLALELANRYAGVFKDSVADVVPVIGLMAETAETASLTEVDARHLATLAAMEPKAFDRLMWSADRFVSGEAPVPADRRERLLMLLDLYGIAKAVELVRAGSSGAGPLRRELSNLSRIGDLKRTLTLYFRDQDHVLKGRSVIEALERLVFNAAGPGLGGLRSGLEALRLDPLIHPIAELEVWHDCCTGRVALGESWTEEMRLLFTPGPLAGRLGAPSDDPTVLRETAQKAMGRWRSFMVTDATPAQAGVARVVLRSYQLAWQAIP